ncbi:MAG: type II toxin-antitoxin system VapC family toxin [Solirubrobacteraceae bacterium]
MIFVDSNIPMYVVGNDQLHKAAAMSAIGEALARDQRLVSDAEVLQEILHRYTAIRRTEAIGPAFDALSATVDEIFPIETIDVQAAKEIILGSVRPSARDALHVAVMRRHGIDTIMSFDRGFETMPGIRRVA